MCNIVEEETSQLPVTAIHSAYCHYCDRIQIIPATMFLLSSIIARLFPSLRKRRLARKNERTVFYCGLKFRQPAVGNSFINIPDYCCWGIREGHLRITVPTTHTVSDNVVSFTINIGAEKAEVLLHGKPINLIYLGVDNYAILNQMYADNFVRIVQCHTLCRGKKTDDKYDFALTEYWGQVDGSLSVERRVRSKNCFGLVSLSLSGDKCGKCRKMFENEMKENKQPTQNLKVRSTLAEVTEVTTKEILKQSNTLTEINASSCTPKMEQNLQILHNAQPESTTDGEIILEESEHINMIKVLEQVLPDASNEAKLMLSAQLVALEKSGKDPRSRRWPVEIISLCLSLYCRSPSAYKDLKESKMLILPSERLLRYYKNSVDQQPGFNRQNLQWMCLEARRQNISESGKIGGLLLDEMSIQDDIQVPYSNSYVY